MKIKGVSYDVGRFMGGNWRPVFNPKVVHRELEIIKNDLHCNTVRICGLNLERLIIAAADALGQGLDVWLSPELWDRSQEETLNYIDKAAAAAEKVRQNWPNRLVFSVGSELTLFMQGIVPGKNIKQRIGNPASWEMLKAGKHNAPLNSWLTKANAAARQNFKGPITYASLIWEAVDWSLFDFVGIDHYRAAKIKDKYIEMLKPAFAQGKPVVITEFGSRTYNGADTGTEGLAGDLTDYRPSLPVVTEYLFNRLALLFGVQMPPPRMRLKKGNYVRDEDFQAREIVEQLGLLDRAGVEGAFIMTFVTPIASYDANIRNDLDLNSYALVKAYPHHLHGRRYPDMEWEPKKSFEAVSQYYSEH